MGLALSLRTYSHGQLAFENCNIKSVERVLPVLWMRLRACMFLRSWETTCMLSCFVAHIRMDRHTDWLGILTPYCPHTRYKGQDMDRDIPPPMGVVCIPISSLISRQYRALSLFTLEMRVPPLIRAQSLDVQSIGMGSTVYILGKDFLLLIECPLWWISPHWSQIYPPPHPTLPPLSFLATTFCRALDV